MTAAGRTDAGVHAEGQVAHFDAPFGIPPAGVVAGMNDRLPEAVRVLAAASAPPGFHARFDAVAKTYRYDLLTGVPASPLRARYAWALRDPLDAGAMAEAAGAFAGAHDFRAFFVAPPGEAPSSPVRTVLQARLDACGDRLHFRVTADGFLRYMVRRMVGTLVAVGRGRVPASRVRALLMDPDAPGPRFRAPARGLRLVSVAYPER